MVDTRNDKITGLILAGGLARRMGGGDKGLRHFCGRPLVAAIIERLAPQVDTLILNANQNCGTYAAFGYSVVSDAVANFAGPLAGLHAGLCATRTPLLASVPCDSPFLPGDLVARLYAGLISAGAQVAVAQSGGRRQPVFSLCRREVLDNLTNFLDSGGHKVESWQAGLKTIAVTFPDQSAFANINTLEELSRLEST